MPVLAMSGLTRIAVLVAVVGLAVGGVFAWRAYGRRIATGEGHAPVQPIPFTHATHVRDLALDCRYCHLHAESSSVAGIPPESVCRSCHLEVPAGDPEFGGLWEMLDSGRPIAWIRVNQLSDTIRFSHANHVRLGTACETCHGDVSSQPVTTQIAPLTEGWCVECHIDPSKFVRPVEQVFAVEGTPDKKAGPHPEGPALVAELLINPPLHCSACHR